MGKAVYVGTVVAGSSQEEAITSFLKTVNSSEDNQKGLYSVSESSDKVFLTSTENIVKPISPTTGNTDTKLITAKMESISKALQLPDTNEIVAKESFKLVSSVCHECDSVLVADSKDLLGHCIVCGAEQDQEMEDEEKVDLSIVDDNYQVEDEDGEDMSDEELDAMLSEAEEDEEAEDLEDEEVDEDEELEEDDEVDEEELDAMLSEADDEEAVDEGDLELDFEDDSEDDVMEEDEEDSSESSDEEEMELDTEDEDNEEVSDEELEAMLSEADDAIGEEDFEDEEAEETEDEELAGDDCHVPAANQEACDDAAAMRSQEENTVAVASDIGIEDSLEVDLVTDNLDAGTSTANASVKLVYVPSEVVANHRWYAIVNDAPVAVATVHSVGAEKSEIFASESFRKATETLMAQIGVVAGLQDMGFQSLKIRMPVKQIVESNVAKATQEVKASSEASVQTMREDIKAALATAAVGINKGFFSKLYNPIKAELYELLSNAGVRNAEVLIDDAFMAKADDYHRTLLEQAFDLLSKPVEARNEISKAVMTANYQRASAVEDSSLSSSVSKQLGSIGKTQQTMVASQNEVNPSFNQRAASVIKGLVR